MWHQIHAKLSLVRWLCIINISYIYTKSPHLLIFIIFNLISVEWCINVYKIFKIYFPSPPHKWPFPVPVQIGFRWDVMHNIKKAHFLNLHIEWIKFDCKKWIFCHVKHTTQHSKGKVEKHTKNSRTAVIKFTRMCKSHAQSLAQRHAERHACLHLDIFTLWMKWKMDGNWLRTEAKEERIKL